MATKDTGKVPRKSDEQRWQEIGYAVEMIFGLIVLLVLVEAGLMLATWIFGLLNRLVGA